MTRGVLVPALGAAAVLLLAAAGFASAALHADYAISVEPWEEWPAAPAHADAEARRRVSQKLLDNGQSGYVRPGTYQAPGNAPDKDSNAPPYSVLAGIIIGSGLGVSFMACLCVRRLSIATHARRIAQLESVTQQQQAARQAAEAALPAKPVPILAMHPVAQPDGSRGFAVEVCPTTGGLLGAYLEAGDGTETPSTLGTGSLMHSSLGSLAHSSMARSSLARSSMTEQEASEVELDAAADRALRAAYPSFRAASPGAPGGGGAGGAGGAGISRATPPGFDGLGRPSVGGSRMDRVSGASLGRVSSTGSEPGGGSGRARSRAAALLAAARVSLQRAAYGDPLGVPEPRSGGGGGGGVQTGSSSMPVENSAPHGRAAVGQGALRRRCHGCRQG